MKRIVSVLSIFLLIPFCGSAQDNLLSHQLGAFKSLQKTTHGVQIKTAGNEVVQLTVYSPTIVRVRIAPADLAVSSSYAVIQDAEKNFTNVINNKNDITLTTDSLKIIIQKNPLRLDFYNSKGEWVDGDAPQLGVSWQGKEITSYP